MNCSSGFNTNCSEAYNLSFRIFMASKCGVFNAYSDLYVAGATFYANFYCSRPEVAFTALFYLLIGMCIMCKRVVMSVWATFLILVNLLKRLLYMILRHVRCHGLE